MVVVVYLWKTLHEHFVGWLQVCGIVFEAGDSIEDLANVVGEACQRLSAANIPHNLFVVDCGQRIFLFPNAFARAKAQGLVPEEILESQVGLFLDRTSSMRTSAVDTCGLTCLWRGLLPLLQLM